MREFIRLILRLSILLLIFAAAIYCFMGIDKITKAMVEEPKQHHYYNNYYIDY